jgi:ribosomal protein S18 acetylase RimI-like enzyme
MYETPPRCRIITAVASHSAARVRAAQPGDETSLLQIDIATWTTQVSPGPPPQSGAPFFKTAAADDVLVAEVDREVVGYVKFGLFDELSSSAHVLEIKGLAVAPNHQRRGIGRMLIHAAVELATQRAFRKLMLRVLSTNPQARGLYETCGFETEAILHDQFYLDGNYVGDVFMAIHLTS